MNAPKLRFKEFTDEWQEKKLGDIAGVSSGGTPSRTKPEFWSGTIPWVTTSQINFNLIYNATQFITSAGLRSSAAKIFPVGTVLVALYGQGITRGKVSVLAIDASTNQACAAILADQKFAKSKFLFYFLARQYGSLRKLSNDGSQKNLSGDLLKKLKIVIPNIAEQEKIAGFLTAVDEKIGRLEEKKKGFEKYKKGVMQAIFSQKIRFKSEKGESYPNWEENKLGEIATIKTGNLNVQDALADGEYTFFDRSEEIKKYYKYTFDNEAIIYAGEGSEFMPRYFKGKYGLHQRSYTVFDVKKVIMKYLYYYMTMKGNHFLKMAVGSTVKSLRMNCFLECIILVPSTEEQEKIAELLTSLDNKIDLINKELEQAKLFKKSLLQQMFV